MFCHLLVFATFNLPAKRGTLLILTFVLLLLKIKREFVHQLYVVYTTFYITTVLYRIDFSIL
jgi:hypothetical protein